MDLAVEEARKNTADGEFSRDEAEGEVTQRAADSPETTPQPQTRQPVDPPAAPSSVPAGWSYEQAFIRNRGLITPEEQQKLRNSRVAIAGMGGVGGVDAVTLARLGIGRFTIADPDTFDVANTNRQYGAMTSTYGRNKAEVMAAVLRDINPEVDVRVFKEAIGPDNVDAFLADADLFVDAIDAFVLDARRLIFRKAAEKGIWAITAGPVGFSAIWICFDPGGMSFDQYFDLNDSSTSAEQFAAFIAGVAPKATHRGYTDMAYVDLTTHTAPSASLACQVAAGAMACDVLKILLGRGRVRSAPAYHQFDPFVGQFVRRTLLGANRHPLQRVKRRVLLGMIQRGDKE